MKCSSNLMLLLDKMLKFFFKPLTSLQKFISQIKDSHYFIFSISLPKMLLHKRILPYEIDVPLLPLHYLPNSPQHFNQSLKETTHKNIWSNAKPSSTKYLKWNKFHLSFFSFVEPCMCILAFVPNFNLTN